MSPPTQPATRRTPHAGVPPSAFPGPFLLTVPAPCETTRRRRSGPVREDEPAGWRGAACRNRTDDLLITSEMLYRLS